MTGLIIALIISLLLDAATNIGRVILTVWAVRKSEEAARRVEMEGERLNGIIHARRTLCRVSPTAKARTTRGRIQCTETTEQSQGF